MAACVYAFAVEEGVGFVGIFELWRKSDAIIAAAAVVAVVVSHSSVGGGGGFGL